MESLRSLKKQILVLMTQICLTVRKFASQTADATKMCSSINSEMGFVVNKEREVIESLMEVS